MERTVKTKWSRDLTANLAIFEVKCCGGDDFVKLTGKAGTFMSRTHSHTEDYPAFATFVPNLGSAVILSNSNMTYGVIHGAITRCTYIQNSSGS